MLSGRVHSLATLAALVAIAVPAAAAADSAAPVSVGTPVVVPGGSDQAMQPPATFPAGSGEKRRSSDWIEDGEYAGPTQNCVLQTPEELGRAWTGYYGEIGVNPQVNHVYYVKVGWGISGNPCTGGAGVHAELVLPAYTQPAINNQNPVKCFYESPSQDQLHPFTQDCPQTPQSGFYGGYAFDPPGNQGPWPSARGAIFEIWVPVKTSQPLNGIMPPDGQPCYTCVYAGVWMIDGWNSPWVWPKEGVYVVGSGAPTEPDVTYPGPSVTDPILYDTTNKYIQARMNGNIFNSGSGGDAHFEFGTHAGSYPDDPGPHSTIPGGGNFLVYTDFGFTPGKDVHWRFCYTETGGSGEICGPDQLYKAPPDTGIQKVKVKRRTATVSFDSPVVTNMIPHYQCKLDDKPYKPCTSPKKYKDLKRGNHKVAVRAVDQDGHKDATPAKQAFKV